MKPRRNEEAQAHIGLSSHTKKTEDLIHNMKVLFRQMLPDISKNSDMFERSQASSVGPSNDEYGALVE
jgi:hypothetical protein